MLFFELYGFYLLYTDMELDLEETMDSMFDCGHESDGVLSHVPLMRKKTVEGEAGLRAIEETS